MANFFNSITRMAEHSVTQPFKAVKQTAQGHPGAAFQNLFHDASKTGQDVAHSVGIRGWVGSHPMQSVGALVATIFGGWAAAGAYGAGAAGTAGAAGAGAAGSSAAAGAGAAGAGAAGAGAAGASGATAAAGSSSALLGSGAAMSYAPGAATGITTATGAGGASSLGGAGLSAYMAPAAQGGIASTAGAQAGASLIGSGAYTPTASTVLGGAGSGGTSVMGAAPAVSSSGAAPITAAQGTSTQGVHQSVPELSKWDQMKANWNAKSGMDKAQMANNVLQNVAKISAQNQEPQAGPAPAPSTRQTQIDYSMFQGPRDTGMSSPTGVPAMYQLNGQLTGMGG